MLPAPLRFNPIFPRSRFRGFHGYRSRCGWPRFNPILPRFPVSPAISWRDGEPLLRQRCFNPILPRFPVSPAIHQGR